MQTRFQAIPTSSAAVNTKITIGATAAMLIGIAVTLIFKSAFWIIPRIEAKLLLLLWASFILFWAIWVWLLKDAHRKTSYTLGDDALIVRKATLFGSNEQAYRYNSILSVGVHMSSFSTGDYGNITINLQQSGVPLKLEHVKNPEKYAQKIRQLAS